MGNCFPCTVPLRKSWKTKSVAAAQDNAEARGRGARITRDGNPFNERFTVVCCSGLAANPLYVSVWGNLAKPAAQ